jgi:hypothetical protein
MTSAVVRDIFMTGARGAVVDEKGYHWWVQRAKQGTDGRNTPVGERWSGRSGELLLAEGLHMDMRRRGNGGRGELSPVTVKKGEIGDCGGAAYRRSIAAAALSPGPWAMPHREELCAPAKDRREVASGAVATESPLMSPRGGWIGDSEI